MERSSMLSIELKSISCKGVKSFNLFQKPSLYAVVCVGSGGDRSDKKQMQRQQQKTPVDRDGGENPEWDHPMRFDVGGRDQDLFLEFELKAHAILGDKAVGRARVPVADLDFTGIVQSVSYQLRNPDGKPNGSLSFLYKGNNPEAKVSLPVPASAPAVDYYPPTPSAPAVDYYPPKPSAPTPASAVDYFPPTVGFYPPPSSPGPAVSYPPPTLATTPSFGYFQTPDPIYGFPAQAPDVGGGFYPPLPPAHLVYPPQPAPAYCYPAPPAPAYCYPAPPAPACGYPAPPAPYGYHHGGWDRGLHGYN